MSRYSGHLRCAGELYVAGGAEEYATPEWAYVIRAECNGGEGGDCGFNVVLDEDTTSLDGKAWGITSTDMDELQARHLKHSRGET